jgi:hypothetical protein
VKVVVDKAEAEVGVAGWGVELGWRDVELTTDSPAIACTCDSKL